MKRIETNIITVSAIALVMVFFTLSCAEEGSAGEAAVDCGTHGAEHDGHCHCDAGYLYDGAICVTPEEITAVCGAQADEHTACRCPAEGDCPCDHGTVETIGVDDFCVPERRAPVLRAHASSSCSSSPSPG